MKLYTLVLFTWLPGPVGAINFVFWVRPGNSSRNYTIIGHPCSRRRALFFSKKGNFLLRSLAHGLWHIFVQYC